MLRQAQNNAVQYAICVNQLVRYTIAPIGEKSIDFTGNDWAIL